MSRADSNQVLKRIPIGIIPLGNTNTFSKKWFMMGSDETDETDRINNETDETKRKIDETNRIMDETDRRMMRTKRME